MQTETQAFKEGLEHRSPWFWVVIGTLVLAALSGGYALGMADSPDDALVLVNPCPSEKSVAIYDRPVSSDGRLLEAMGAGEESTAPVISPRAEVTLSTAVTRIPDIDPDDVTDQWSIALPKPDGGHAFQFFPHWYQQGILVIPALDCGAEDLAG